MLKKSFFFLAACFLILALAVVSYLNRIWIFEQVNVYPVAITVSAPEGMPEEITETGEERSFADRSERVRAFQALTTPAPAAATPVYRNISGAPAYDITLRMKNGASRVFRLWPDAASGQVWVCPLPAPEEPESASSVYSLNEADAFFFLSHPYFADIYVSAIWPTAFHLAGYTAGYTAGYPGPDHSPGTGADEGGGSKDSGSSDSEPQLLRCNGRVLAVTHTITSDSPAGVSPIRTIYKEAPLSLPLPVVDVTRISDLQVVIPAGADRFEQRYYPTTLEDAPQTLAAALALANARTGLSGKSDEDPAWGTDPGVDRPRHSGSYVAVVTVFYGNKTPSLTGTVVGAFLLTYTPSPQVFLSDDTPAQGTLVSLSLAYAGPASTHAYRLSVPYLSDAIPLPVRDDGTAIVLFPVPNTTKAGTYTLKVSERISDPVTGSQSGWQEIIETTLIVSKKTFTRQDLTATPSMSALATNDNYRHDNEKISAAKAQSSPVPYWQGSLVMPVEGPLSTEYGEERYTNGVFTSRHSGLDIVAAAGTPVVAAAAGKVVLAYPLIVSGNTVIIDHGAGLFSSYLHLESYQVAAGDTVQAGQIIAAVGSTGYSTGPHLHFAVALGSTYLDPKYLTRLNPWEAALERARAAME